MTLEIKVKFGGMRHLAIDDCAGWAVTTLISIAIRLREEPENQELINSADMKRYKSTT